MESAFLSVTACLSATPRMSRRQARGTLSTMMTSASVMVLRRCATMIVVRSARMAFSAPWMRCSVSVSSALVASSCKRGSVQF